MSDDAARKDQDAARVIGRALWEREQKASRPDASAEEKKAAWHAVRADYVKAGRFVLARLERKGFTVHAPAGPVED